VDSQGKLDVKTVRLGLLALVVLVAVVFLLVTVLGGDDDSGDETTAASSGEPVALSESELIAEAANFSHPGYWIGPLPDIESYELTQTEDGRIYVRYLPEGTEAGDPNPNFLTVGTYAVPDAKSALGSAEEGGGTEGVTEEDGFTMLKGGSGQNAYVVFDDQPDLQIEVFAPGQGDAVELATSGALKPIG
jgi:hypothetical protein